MTAPRAQEPWTPDMPLRHDATDEQIIERRQWWNNQPTANDIYIIGTVARELAVACAAEARRAAERERRGKPAAWQLGDKLPDDSIRWIGEIRSERVAREQLTTGMVDAIRPLYAAPPIPPTTGEEKCADCGCVLDSGTAAVFTVCDACWDKAYRRPTPEPSEAMVEADIPLHPIGHRAIAERVAESLQFEDVAPHEWNRERFERFIADVVRVLDGAKIACAAALAAQEGKP